MASFKNSDYDYFVKLIIIGRVHTGKSCLLMRFADDEFTTSDIATMG